MCVCGKRDRHYCAFGAVSVSRFSTFNSDCVLSRIFLYAASVSCMVRSYLQQMKCARVCVCARARVCVCVCTRKMKRKGGKRNILSRHSTFKTLPGSFIPRFRQQKHPPHWAQNCFTTSNQAKQKRTHTSTYFREGQDCRRVREERSNYRRDPKASHAVKPIRPD